MSKKRPKFSQKLGNFFAHLQIGLDDLADFAFRKLKAAGSKTEDTQEKTAEKKNFSTKAKAFGKSTARFFGETGSAFYAKYEELKAKKHQHKKTD
jgi:hypothetical protein